MEKLLFESIWKAVSKANCIWKKEIFDNFKLVCLTHTQFSVGENPKWPTVPYLYFHILINLDISQLDALLSEITLSPFSWLQINTSLDSDFRSWNKEEFLKGFYLANGKGPRCDTVRVDPHKIKSKVQSQAVLSAVCSGGWALPPDKVPDREIACGPLPNTVHAHICAGGPPDVTPLHLEEDKLCPHEIELYLCGNFSQGAPGLKLANVVGGSPVAAGGRVEEQTAEIDRVAIHPSLWATSLPKFKVLIIWRTKGVFGKHESFCRKCLSCQGVRGLVYQKYLLLLAPSAIRT